MVTHDEREKIGPFSCGKEISGRRAWYQGIFQKGRGEFGARRPVFFFEENLEY